MGERDLRYLKFYEKYMSNHQNNQFTGPLLHEYFNSDTRAHNQRKFSPTKHRNIILCTCVLSQQRFANAFMRLLQDLHFHERLAPVSVNWELGIYSFTLAEGNTAATDFFCRCDLKCAQRLNGMVHLFLICDNI